MHDMTARRKAEFQTAVRRYGFGPNWEQFYEECGGVCRMFVARQDEVDAAPLEWEWKARFEKARMAWFAKLLAGDRPLCVACERELTRGLAACPLAMIVIEPDRDDTETAVLSPVCSACAQRSDEELIAIAIKGLKEIGLADRVVGLLGRAGHA